MTEAMTYRDAGPHDADALAALFRDSFTDTFGHLYRPEDLATFLSGFGEARWAAELADPAFAIRLAEKGRKPVGYLKLGPRSLPVEPQGTAIELKHLYLIHLAQGTGAGAALMEWALATARARGADEMLLSVYIDNHRAKRFYTRYGFERVGRYTFMVGDHADEDELMRLAL